MANQLLNGILGLGGPLSGGTTRSADPYADKYGKLAIGAKLAALGFVYRHDSMAFVKDMGNGSSLKIVEPISGMYTDIIERAFDLVGIKMAGTAKHLMDAQMEEILKRQSLAEAMKQYNIDPSVYLSPSGYQAVQPNPYGVQVKEWGEAAKSLSMLRSRLEFNSKTEYKFEFLKTAFDPEKQEVIVFAVVSGQDVTLRDGISMFPSDTLITQIRMLF